MKLLQQVRWPAAELRQLLRVRSGQFACAVMLSLLIGCGAGDRSSLNIGKVRKLIDAGQFAEAVVGLRSVLQLHPDTAEARMLLGRIHLISGDALNAEVELRRALTGGSPKDEVVPLLARAMLDAGRAKAVVDEFGSFEPASGESWIELKSVIADALARINQVDRANALLEEVLKRQPLAARALLVQARLIAGAGKVDAALQVVEGVLKREAKNLDALRLKADLLAYSKRDVEGAIPVYIALVQAAPTRIDGRAALISALLLSQKIDEATRQIGELKALAPQNMQTLLFEAHLSHVKKDYAKARDIANQLMKYAPTSVELMELAGSAELNLGAWQNASVLLGKAVFAEPKRVRARQLLARSLVMGGRPEKALEALRPLLDAAPPPLEAQIIAAEAHVLLGQSDKAQLLFAHAAKMRPEDNRLKATLALLDATNGNPEKAVSALTAIAVGSEETSADMALFSLQMQRRNYDGALAAAQRLDKKTPKSPTPLYLQGQAQAGQGDRAATRRSFEAALQRSPKYFSAIASLAYLDAREGKPETGWNRLDAFLVAEPTVEAGWLALMGLANQFVDRPTRQMKVIERALAAIPTSVELSVLKVDLQLKENRAKEALATAQALRTANPQRVDVLDALGRAQMATGDIQQAQRTYGEMIVLAPKSSVAHLRQANVLRLAGGLAGALSSARRATELAPADPAAMVTLIALSIQAGQPDAALQVIKERKRRTPDDAMPLVYEGDLLNGLKQPDAALAAFRTGTSLPKNASLAASRLHANLLQAKRSVEAADFAQAWLRNQPEDVHFLTHLGDVALHARNFPEVESRFRSVLAVQPGNAVALNNVAWSLIRQGKPGALELARKAVKLEPVHDGFNDTLALALGEAGDLKQATELQTQLVQRNPQQPLLRLHLAQLLLKANDRESARSHVEALAKLGSGFAERAEVARLQAQLRP